MWPVSSGCSLFLAMAISSIKSNNLSDVDAATARTNLDVDSKAEVTSKATDSGIIFAIALG